MTEKLIDARHAVIHTASIQIRTLTIGGKQVTLSVFRQLPELPWGDMFLHYPEEIESSHESDLFSSSFIPWGIVRYYWGIYHEPTKTDGWSGFADDAYHAILQQGNNLYRAYCTTKGPRYEHHSKYWDFPIGYGLSRESWEYRVLSQANNLPQLFIAI
jgi:hypothetical protein